MISIQCHVPMAMDPDIDGVEVSSTKSPGVVELRIFSYELKEYVKVLVNSDDLELAAKTAAAIEWGC